MFVLGLIIDALAPKFGSEKNSAQALKVAVYSFTPGWAVGVVRILPSLGILAGLASFYGIYLLYLGLPRLMKSPQEKAVVYTLVVVALRVRRLPGRGPDFRSDRGRGSDGDGRSSVRHSLAPVTSARGAERAPTINTERT